MLRMAAQLLQEKLLTVTRMRQAFLVAQAPLKERI